MLDGEISEGDLAKLQGEIEALLEPRESVILDELSTDSLLNRTVYGRNPAQESWFL